MRDYSELIIEARDCLKSLSHGFLHNEDALVLNKQAQALSAVVAEIEAITFWRCAQIRNRSDSFVAESQVG